VSKKTQYFIFDHNLGKWGTDYPNPFTDKFSMKLKFPPALLHYLPKYDCSNNHQKFDSCHHI